MDIAVVYLLKSKSGRFYIGSTNCINRQLIQHNAGLVYSTKRLGLPLQLVAYRNYETLKEAKRMELQLKRWKNPQKVREYLQKLDD